MMSDIVTASKNELGNRFTKILGKSVETVAAVQRARELPRDENGRVIRDPMKRPSDMSVEEFGIALDAHLPNRDAPVYLTQDLERVTNAQKIAGHLAEPPPIRNYVIHAVEPRKYDVIEAKTVEVKGGPK